MTRLAVARSTCLDMRGRAWTLVRHTMLHSLASGLLVGALLLFAGGCSVFGSSPRVDPPSVMLQESGTSASLRGIAAVGEDVAWASGLGGTVCRTLDGGAHWEVLVIPGAEDADVRSVVAFDADNAIFATAGTPARIYRTDSGGQSFDLVYESRLPEVFFDSLVFADGRVGYAFSDPVRGRFWFMRTVDGGLTWRKVPAESALPRPIEGEAGFAASNSMMCTHGARHVWIGTGGGETARVFRTADAGASWAIAEVGLGQGGDSSGVFSIAFWDERHGVAVGGDYRKPAGTSRAAAYSEDGGATWRNCAGTAAPSGYRSGVALVRGRSARTAIAVGTNGMDATADGGRSWTRIGEQGFHAVAFEPDGRVGWAVGVDGQIARLEFARGSGR